MFVRYAFLADHVLFDAVRRLDGVKLILNDYLVALGLIRRERNIRYIFTENSQIW
jgi:hypothetical protein